MNHAKRALVLGACLVGLAACGGSSGAQAKQIADGAREAVNAYCDARQKALEALGEAGAAP